MSVAALSPDEVRVLQGALGAIGQGNAERAEQAIRAMRAAARGHPDALYVLATARRAQGDGAGARQAFEAGLQAAPANIGLWNAYGGLLRALGDPVSAATAYRRAVRLEPRFAEGWINLAIAALDGGDHSAVEEALAQAARLAPGDARIPSVRGALEQARGNAQAAAEAYRRALQLAPGDLRAQHNLATALRDCDRREEALGTAEQAIAAGLNIPETLTLRAHLLAELGRMDEAEAQYRDVLARTPNYLDAQDTLARLLPQIGRADEALDAYGAALAAHPEDAALRRSAVKAASDLKRPREMLAWIESAPAALADELAQGRLYAHLLDGDIGAAMDGAQALEARDPARPGLQAMLATLKLRIGDLRAAEAHALRATEQAPLNQSGWALLTIIWRLLEDPREQRLVDYDRHVRSIDLGTPQGWSSQSAFLDDLTEALTALHVTRAHPADQTLRGGTQTRGDLFRASAHPVIRALRGQIRLAIAEFLGGLAVEPGHPFTGRISRDFDFIGSWSVRLRSEGFHVSHIHAEGWLSSACYISLPGEIGAAQGDQSGALCFGVPDALTGQSALAPRRVIVPRPGHLALFPSYVWHGTLPFESEDPRLTVAFDALPVA